MENSSLQQFSPPTWIVRHVLKRPKLCLTLFVLAFSALSLGIPKVKFVNQFERDLPENDPILQTNRRFEEVFGEKDLLMAALVNDAGIYNERTLTKLFELSRDFEEIDGVLPGSIESLCTVKNISSSDSMLDIAPFYEDPPAGEADVSAIRAAVEENFMARGRLAAFDGTATALRADLAPDHDVATVYKQARAIAQQHAGPERLYLTGDSVVDYEVTSSMRRDVAFLFPVSLVLAVAILFAAFRSFN